VENEVKEEYVEIIEGEMRKEVLSFRRKRKTELTEEAKVISFL